MKNILSFDIEEHYQVSGLAAAVSRDSWDSHESRVERNTHKILELLDRHQVRATFFILGIVAEKHPQLVREIAEGGHELASHGYDHKLIYDMTNDQFREELIRTNDLLESISNKKIIGHRAPSFSLALNDIDKFEILAELDFKYDSSLFPIKHFRYGDAQQAPLAPFSVKKDGQAIIREFPLTAVEFLGKRIPAAGGGYFRLYPNFLIRRNIRLANSEQRPTIVYLHPWEFDPDQPRIKGAGLGNTFRHYINLHKTYGKVEMMIKKFEFCSFDDYMARRSA
jgi:polysaccharide deacetylase family protein (PEP-CTERM system associated)